jgi:phosphoribosylamine-glycine ligase
LARERRDGRGGFRQKVAFFFPSLRRSAETPLQIVTNGGRVLGVTALGKDLRSAQAAAYAAVECIQFEGAQFRRDIAAKAIY